MHTAATDSLCLESGDWRYALELLVRVASLGPVAFRFSPNLKSLIPQVTRI